MLCETRPCFWGHTDIIARIFSSAKGPSSRRELHSFFRGFTAHAASLFPHRVSNTRVEMLARAVRGVGFDAREGASQGGLFGNPMLADAPWRAIRLYVAPELRSVAQKRGGQAQSLHRSKSENSAPPMAHLGLTPLHKFDPLTCIVPIQSTAAPSDSAPRRRPHRSRWLLKRGEVLPPTPSKQRRR